MDNGFFNEKIILLTGGTGSFGSQFTEVVLKEHHPRTLRIYSRDEFKQLDMQQRLSDNRLHFLLGDVRDKDQLYRAMEGVDLVVHAAALKQVPTAEYNPLEAVKTNVLGTANVIDAAIDRGVKKVIFISTDKAVHPVNLYGATKLIAEKLIIQANARSGAVPTRFSGVRYGNVLGSRGSVIPIFLKQRKTGVLRITDDRMTRFWITLAEGVSFVIECMERMRGGEVFVPRIRSMKIVDLARCIAPDAKWEIVGVRAGEKVHEELVTQEEAPRTTRFEKFYLIEPESVPWDRRPLPGGEPVPKDFKYTSATNDLWLTPAELKAWMAEQAP